MTEVRPAATAQHHVCDEFCLIEVETCPRCNEVGEVVTCWDDLCANSDECIHGDGYGPCPDCHATGRVAVCLTKETPDDH